MHKAGEFVMPKASCGVFKRLVPALTAIFLAFLALTSVSADTRPALSASELLKAARQTKATPPKPAYENISTEPQRRAPEPNQALQAPTEKRIEPSVSVPPAVAAVDATGVKPTGDDLLRLMPADCLFCLRVNNFDYTLSRLEQFAGMPMVFSASVRMGFARMLGSPQLGGLNLAGNFGVFAIPVPGEKTFVTGMLIPVSDYKQFVSGNPNVGRPNYKGVSIIRGPEEQTSVIRVGNYLLTTEPGNEASLTQTARLISGNAADITRMLDAEKVTGAMRESFWLHVNFRQIFRTLGPRPLSKMMGFKEAMSGTRGDGPAKPGDAAVVDGYTVAMEKLLMTQAKSLTVVLKPQPNVCSLVINISAVPGTALAKAFSSTSAETADANLPLSAFISQAKAAGARLSPAERQAVSELLGGAEQADFVTRINLLQLFNAAMAAVPSPIPPMNFPTKSYAALAGRAGNGQMTINITVPREHILEIMQGVQMSVTGVRMEPPAPVTALSNDRNSKPLPGTWASADQAVQGQIKGKEVILEKAVLQGNTLAIYTGDSWDSNPSLLLFLLDIEGGTVPSNRSFSVEPSRISSSRIQIHCRWKDAPSGRIKSESIVQGYKLDLQFGGRGNGTIPGTIMFEIPGKDTRLQGRFAAGIEKSNE